MVFGGFGNLFLLNIFFVDIFIHDVFLVPFIPFHPLIPFPLLTPPPFVLPVVLVIMCVFVCVHTVCISMDVGLLTRWTIYSGYITEENDSASPSNHLLSIVQQERWDPSPPSSSASFEGTTN